MYHQLDYQQFVEFLQRLCWQKGSGFVFFSTVDDAWGKVKFQQGEIVAIGYNAVWGRDSLAMIRQLKQVKCFYQKNTNEAERALLAPSSLPGTAEILSMLLATDSLVEIERAERSILDGMAESNPPVNSRDESRPDVSAVESEPVLEHALNDLAAPRALRSGQAEKHVLVADDSQVIRDMLMQALVSAGYRVTEARDGYEALGLAEEVRPDLMIVDAHMPGIDGYRVLISVRSNRRLRKTPVFLLTRGVGLLPLLKGRIADCDEFIQKPLDVTELLKLVRKHLFALRLG